MARALKLPASPQEIALQVKEIAVQAKEMDNGTSNDNLVQLGEVQKHITEAILAAEKDNKQQNLLVRLLLQRAELRKTVAMRRSEDLKDFERKLKSLLNKRSRRR